MVQIMVQTQSASWWALALGSDRFVFLAAVAGACVVALALVARVMLRLRGSVAAEPAGRSRWGRFRGRVDSERGVATLEFMLVFPFLMFLIMLLLQTMLVMVGQVYVHYAAFAATRAAIVQVPADYSSGRWFQRTGEPRNEIDLRRGSPKFDAVHRAAAYAVVPVSGRDAGGFYDEGAYTAALDDYFAATGRESPNWVDRLAGPRLGYAADNTWVALMDAEVSNNAVSFSPMAGRVTIGPRDPVTVRVRHHLNLSIPYTRMIFADGTHQTQDGDGAYTAVEAQYTLTNEGLNANLPPLPELPRRP